MQVAGKDGQKKADQNFNWTVTRVASVLNAWVTQFYGRWVLKMYSPPALQWKNMNSL